MAGHGGKTYELWPIGEAEKFADAVYQYAKDNKNCYTLGQAAVEVGEYEEVISYLEKKFEIEFQSIKKAREIIKNRCLHLGMDGTTNATMTIFNLVNNFDMLNTNAKQKVEAKVEQTVKQDLSALTEEELIKLNELTTKLGNQSGAI
jgi:hypothetical protein